MPQNKGKGNNNNPHNNGNDHNEDGHPDNGKGKNNDHNNCFNPHHNWHYGDHNTGHCTVEEITCPKELYKGNNHYYSHTCDPVEPIVLDSAPEPSSIVLLTLGIVSIGVWRLVKSKTTRQVGC